MGEARRRGTFEQRRAAAIKRNKEAEQQELAAINVRPDPTFEEIIRQKQAMRLLGIMEGLILSGSNSLDCAGAQSALGQQKQKPRVLANRRQPAICESSKPQQAKAVRRHSYIQ